MRDVAAFMAIGTTGSCQRARKSNHVIVTRCLRRLHPEMDRQFEQLQLLIVDDIELRNIATHQSSLIPVIVPPIGEEWGENLSETEISSAVEEFIYQQCHSLREFAGVAREFIKLGGLAVGQRKW